MKVSELIDAVELESIYLHEPDREIKTVYIGDLLSWVMGSAKDDSAWITIMSNHNVAAVAVMAEVACVILAENVTPDKELVLSAQKQGVNLLKSKKDAYELSWRLHEII